MYSCVLFILTLFTVLAASKNSDEYKPDIGRVGKTKKAKMGMCCKINF